MSQANKEKAACAQILQHAGEPGMSQADVDRFLDEGRIGIRGMVRFDFATGTYGFWQGASDWEYNGVLYRPGGIIEVSAIPGEWGMAAAGVEISLAASPDDGLTPEVLASIESEIYHQRPVTILDAYFHPEMGELLFVEALYRGFIDRVEHSVGPNGRITAYSESRALDNNRENYRMRSSADQFLIRQGDMFFQSVETTGREEIWWGRNKG